MGAPLGNQNARKGGGGRKKSPRKRFSGKTKFTRNPKVLIPKGFKKTKWKGIYEG